MRSGVRLLFGAVIVGLALSVHLYDTCGDDIGSSPLSVNVPSMLDRLKFCLPYSESRPQSAPSDFIDSIIRGISSEIAGDCSTAISAWEDTFMRHRDPPFLVLWARSLLLCGHTLEAARILSDLATTAPAFGLLGHIHRFSGDVRNAVLAFERALELDSSDSAVWNDYGTALLDTGNNAAAQFAFEQSLSRNRDNAEAWNNLGIVYHNQQLLRKSLRAYENAVAVRPSFAAAWFNYANLLAFTGNSALGINAYDRALEVDGSLFRALVNRAFYRQGICNWTSALEADYSQIREAIAVGGGNLDGIQVFQSLMFPLSDKERLAVVRHHANNVRRRASAVAVPFSSWMQAFNFVQANKRLRIGYLSGDFGAHITTRLVQSLFGLHDRSKFEVFVYAGSVSDNSPERLAIEESGDHFVDLSALGNAEAAQRIHNDGIAILVELDGYTARNRMEIDALRPAPLQIFHMGYPGTIGGNFVDHFVGDRVALPPDLRSQFTEKIILMPNSYQANDHAQSYRVLPTPPSKESLGLDPQAVVYCEFNQLYKIDSAVFSLWMRILHRVPTAILWLLRNPRDGEHILKHQASVFGIDSDRIVFTDQCTGSSLSFGLLTFIVDQPSAFVSASAVCDVFLDTLLCNAHATAADVLWQGTPIVTMPGRTFTQRVASSLLTALDSSVLIASSESEYVDIAVSLASYPGSLSGIRAELRRKVDMAPLFDTKRYVKDFELGIELAWDAFVRQGRPQHVIIRKQ